MTAARLFGRGLAFPVCIDGHGGLAWSEGEQNIEESIRLILLTEPEERLFRPDFGCGLRSFLFEPNTVATRHRISERVAASLAAWEPRIVVRSVETVPDPEDPEAAITTIQYRLVATQAQGNLSLGVRLGG